MNAEEFGSICYGNMYMNMYIETKKQNIEKCSLQYIIELIKNKEISL